MPLLSTDRRTIAEQQFLFVRRTVAAAQLSQAIGECLGQTFAFAQQSGAAIAGRPLTRYIDMRDGQMTIEGGVAVAPPARGDGAVEAGVLPGGDTLVALHAGHYETLGESYRALEQRMAEQGCRANGAPWELYLTDPAPHSNPDDWRTEIYWPIAAK